MIAGEILGRWNLGALRTTEANALADYDRLNATLSKEYADMDEIKKGKEVELADHQDEIAKATTERDETQGTKDSDEAFVASLTTRCDEKAAEYQREHKIGNPLNTELKLCFNAIRNADVRQDCFDTIEECDEKKMGFNTLEDIGPGTNGKLLGELRKTILKLQENCWGRDWSRPTIYSRWEI